MRKNIGTGSFNIIFFDQMIVSFEITYSRSTVISNDIFSVRYIKNLHVYCKDCYIFEIVGKNF